MLPLDDTRITPRYAAVDTLRFYAPRTHYAPLIISLCLRYVAITLVDAFAYVYAPCRYADIFAATPPRHVTVTP